MRTFHCLSFIAVMLCAWPVEAQTKDAPITWMLKPGKTLLSDDLNQPFSKDWNEGKGKWEVIDGVMRGSELKSDEHGAVKRRSVKFNSAVIAFAFRLDGAKTISLSINAAKGHMCRVKINNKGFSLVRDKDKQKNEKAAVLDSCVVAIGKGEWHTMVIELHGKELLARMDDKHAAFGEHKEIAAAKANVGLTVAGDSASFKNLRVYEGAVADGWDKQRAKLLEQRKRK